LDGGEVLKISYLTAFESIFPLQKSRVRLNGLTLLLGMSEIFRSRI